MSIVQSKDDRVHSHVAEDDFVNETARMIARCAAHQITGDSMPGDVNQREIFSHEPIPGNSATVHGLTAPMGVDDHRTFELQMDEITRNRESGQMTPYAPEED